MAVSLGLGLGISVSGTTAGGIPSFLYLTAQDGSILQGQKNRGDDLSAALILYEPNSVASDSLPDPTDLLLTQDSNVLFTEAGRGIARNTSDRPYDRLLSQDDKYMLTQDGRFIVSQEVS